MIGSTVNRYGSTSIYGVALTKSGSRHGSSNYMYATEMPALIFSDSGYSTNQAFKTTSHSPR